MKTLFLFLTFLILAVGCHNREKPYSIDDSFWPPVEDEADSLVAIINAKAAHTIYEPGDTILTNRIDSIGRVKELPQLRSRALFWKVMVNSRHGLDSTLVSMLEQAIAICDSASYPYDHTRMIMARPNVPVMSPELAASYLNAIELFRQYGDSLNYAATKSMLGYHIDKYDHDKGLEMNLSASKTLHNIKAYEYLVSLDYNIAASLYETFQDKRAFAMMDSLWNNPEFRKHNKLILLVDMLYYDKDKNPYYLYDALNRCDSLKNPHSMSGYVLSTLAVHYMEKNMPDSMRYFKNRINSEMLDRPRTKHLVYANMVRLYEFEGKPDSVALFQPFIDTYEKEKKDRLLGSQTESQLMSNTLEDLESDLAKSKSTKRKTLGVMLLISAILLAISGLAIWSLVRRKRMHRRQLVAEQRRAAISEVKAAEKERALAEIVESVQQNGDEMDPMIARIKAKLTPESDWQRVKLLFDEINPEFTESLKQNYPTLTQSEARLACLIYLGLDTKHIARLLAIAPDSVKKTRQRLRAKLPITPDTDLHDFLSAIMR